MSVALVRIDDRLVHAQVIEGWLKETGADHIVVVSDIVAADEIQKAMYSFSVPYGVKISCLSVEDASRILPALISGSEKLLILLPSFYEAAALLDSGVRFETINVGGLHAREGKEFYTPTISVDDKDIEYARKLSAAGTKLETRVLPMHEKKDFFEVIKNPPEESANR